MHGLIAGLAGLFAAELFFVLESSAYRTPPAEFAAQVPGVQTVAFGASGVALSAQRNVLLDRPLFDASRRPSAGNAAPAPVEIPRLSGIIITPAERIAVFSSEKGHSIIVARDSRLGAFTVLSITQNSVTVRGPGGVIVFRSDVNYQGPSEKTPTDSAVLPGGIDPGGIDLGQLNVPLPSAATWAGPPAAN